MHDLETKMLLKHYLEQGFSKAELARRFGVSRRTIYYWIGTGQLDHQPGSHAVGYSPRPKAPRKLDPYKAIINTRLEAYPKLTARRLFEEVRAAGYEGGYSSLSEYIRQVRPRELADPVVRYETPAGRQGQVDFGSFSLPWGRRHALLVVLSYSRLLWLRFFQRQTMEVLFQGLESAFERFGGVQQELLFDQMRSVAISDHRDRGGALVLNAEFQRFARHWGFRTRLCRPYRARTKGKIERPIRYLRQSFFYGRQFVSDEDLNDQAQRWLEGTANVRLHATTGERPDERFERFERAVLGPLAPSPYRRLGAEPRPTPGPRLLTPVRVQQRPLRVYAEAVR